MSDDRSGIRASYRLYGRLLADIDREMRACGLSNAEWRVLIELSHLPSQTQAGLGTMLGLDRAHTSRTVKSLMGRGLLVSEPVVGKKRFQFSLSKPGAAAAKLVREQWSNAIDAQLKRISHDDIIGVLASQGGLARYRSGATELLTLKPEGLGWMVERAAQIGKSELRTVTNGIEKYLDFNVATLGATAWLNGRIVGTCMAVTDSEQLIAELVGFYIDRDAARSGAEQLLRKIISASVYITFSRLIAWISEKDRLQSALLERCGFERSKESRTRIIGLKDTEIDRQNAYWLTLPMLAF